MDANRPKLLIIMNIPAARHPFVHMCNATFREEYDFVIASPDPDEVRRTFPNANCVNVEPTYSLRSMLGLRRRATNDLQPQPEIVSRSQSRDPKGRVDLNLLFYYAHTTIWLTWSLLRKFRPTAIIAIDAGLLPTARLLGTILRVPYFYFVCEVFPNQFPWISRKVMNTMALIEKFGARGASTSFVPDIAFTKLLARRYRVRRATCVEIGTCPEVPVTSATAKINDPLRIYYHGAYDPDRGLENLVLAMSHVSGAHLYLRVIGQHLENLFSLVQQRGLTDRISFLDPLPVQELASASTEFDVGVIVASPTTANGRFVIGYKLYEYMAAGLCVIAPNSHILAPFLSRHDVGVSYKGCDIAEISAAIDLCVQNREKVKNWKKRARELAETEFNSTVQGLRLREAVRSKHQNAHMNGR
jgi:glycosyltransferase involved in cell wall biosynthesis